MGKYINPSNESKEQFLNRLGTEIPVSILNQRGFQNIIIDGNLAVCLVDNGMFTAAGIMDSQKEMDDWIVNLKDERPKKYYLVNKEHLVSFLK